MPAPPPHQLRAIHRYATADRAAGHPWQTTLPFPVQVVASTSVTDYFSGTTLTSEYLYHHGYWDGADREFRGFARVDQRDTLTRHRGPRRPFYSPPTETRTWFHLGPVGPESGAWTEGLDLSAEYWPEDPPLTGQADVSGPPRGHAPPGPALRHPRAARPGAAQRAVRARRRPQRRPPLPDHRPRLRARPRARRPAGHRPRLAGAPVIAVQPTSRPDHRLGTRHRPDDPGHTSPAATTTTADPTRRSRSRSPAAATRGSARPPAASPYLAT